MNQENFQLSKIQRLSPIEARDYITKYFIPLSNGNHAMLIDGKYIVKDDMEIKRTYLNRLKPKELATYYLHEFDGVKTIVFEMNKPTFFDDKINLCPPMINNLTADEYIPDEDTKVKLNIVLNHLEEVLCSGDHDVFEFLMKWISNVVRGGRNQSCLYLKGEQGTGKSTLFEFLSKFVIGKDLCIETGSDPIKTKFNEILAGKLLVCIEELENFTRGEWESINSTLKRMITSDNIVYQNKCTKAFESNNLNNYILISNNDAIKDDDGRRYFTVDISTDKIGDREYFKKLRECLTMDVGKAFFHHCHSIDLTGYDSQAYPFSKSKLDSISKRLDPVSKFIKEQYVLEKKDIDCRFSLLYSQFKNQYTQLKLSKEDFRKRITEIGIKQIVDEKNKIHLRISYNKLLKIAAVKNWIHETDEFHE